MPHIRVPGIEATAFSLWRARPSEAEARGGLIGSKFKVPGLMLLKPVTGYRLEYACQELTTCYAPVYASFTSSFVMVPMVSVVTITAV